MNANARQVGGDHYKNMSVEPWVAMASWLTHDQFLGYLIGSALGYLARLNVAGVRGKGGLSDVEKAAHYLQKAIEVMRARAGALDSTDRISAGTKDRRNRPSSFLDELMEALSEDPAQEAAKPAPGEPNMDDATLEQLRAILAGFGRKATLVGAVAYDPRTGEAHSLFGGDAELPEDLRALLRTLNAAASDK